MRDALAEFADGLAYDSSSGILDLGPGRPGPGREHRLEFIGSSDLAGATGILIQHGDDSGLADAADVVEITDAALAGGIVGFTLPSNVKRYVQASLVGTTTAGTWSLNWVIDCAQTNN